MRNEQAAILSTNNIIDAKRPQRPLVIKCTVGLPEYAHAQHVVMGKLAYLPLFAALFALAFASLLDGILGSSPVEGSDHPAYKSVRGTKLATKWIKAKRNGQTSKPVVGTRLESSTERGTSDKQLRLVDFLSQVLENPGPGVLETLGSERCKDLDVGRVLGKPASKKRSLEFTSISNLLS